MSVVHPFYFAGFIADAAETFCTLFAECHKVFFGIPR
jgi:hypothetical protein